MGVLYQKSRGSLIGEDAGPAQYSLRVAKKWACPGCHKWRPRSWRVSFTATAKDTGATRQLAICRKCWRNAGQHYGLASGDHIVFQEGR